MNSEKQLSQLLDECKEMLHNAGVVNSSGETEIIFSEILGIPSIDLFLCGDTSVCTSKRGKILDVVARRVSGEPLQYILKKAWFRQLCLDVGSGVLIPRPETELLAGFIIDLLPQNSRLCDICTGSGAIALSVGFEREDISVVAVDISSDALKYAERNKRKYALNNISFYCGDLFDPLDGMIFDAVVSNPPYVTEDEYGSLAPEVCDHEPAIALRGGVDGLDIVRCLVGSAPHYLKQGGLLALEIGHMQGGAVAELLASSGLFENVRVEKDLAGRERFVLAIRSKLDFS